MKSIKEYKTTGEWFIDARNSGYSVPGAMCHGLNVGQKELGLSFHEVFKLFIRHGVIIQANNVFFYNMMGHLKIKEDKAKKYFVEECDIFYSHFDHSILGWFDNLEEAKKFADEKAENAYYFNTYCVFEPEEGCSFLEENDNCIYEVKGKIT